MRKMFFILLVCMLFNALTCSNAFSQWQKLNTTGSVPHLKNASAIYDPSGNRMIIYGGRNAAGVPTDGIYSLNLNTNTWSQITPLTGFNPAPRFTQNAFYEPNDNAMIIWSGQGSAATLYSDVWSFSFVSNNWSQLWPDGNSSGPARRYGTASVYEPVTKRITTFAGFTAAGRFEDTWTFDITGSQWIDRTNNPHPQKRCLHAGVYAADLGKFVIYAGQDDNGVRDDIWQCTLSSFVWSDITPAVKPSPRFWNSIIYYNGGNILIFGGLSQTPKNDMWKFRMGSNLWEQVNQGVTIPGARWGHTGIYIPSQDRMIIFGGEGDSLYSDTWQYSNVSVIGIGPISNVTPHEFKLEQNYPNPFNPVTKIKFATPLSPPEGGKFVKLSISDLTGREISVLVNGVLKADEYEIEFDGSSLPSGVYFYRLTSGTFTQTRKMILVK